MGAGFQAWDANGNLIVDTETMIYKEITTVAVTNDGEMSFGSIPNNNTLAAVADADTAIVSVSVDQTNNKVSWKFNTGDTNYRRANVRVAML